MGVASSGRRKSRQRISVLAVDGLDVHVARKPMKTMTLRVAPTGEVRVSCPARISDARIASFVREKRSWIDAARSRVLAERAAERDQWRDGATICLWGEPLEIRVDGTAGTRQAGSVRREGGALIVDPGSSPEAGGADEEARVRRLVVRWLAGRMRDELPAIIARSEAEVGVHASGWRIRKMKTRWGSCNVRTGQITLNAELAERPLPCLEGVVVHELCHLIEPSHDARFHALMDEHFPDWRAWRRTLNERPPRRG